MASAAYVGTDFLKHTRLRTRHLERYFLVETFFQIIVLATVENKASHCAMTMQLCLLYVELYYKKFLELYAILSLTKHFGIFGKMQLAQGLFEAQQLVFFDYITRQSFGHPAMYFGNQRCNKRLESLGIYIVAFRLLGCAVLRCECNLRLALPFRQLLYFGMDNVDTSAEFAWFTKQNIGFLPVDAFAYPVDSLKPHNFNHARIVGKCSDQFFLVCTNFLQLKTDEFPLNLNIRQILV